MDGQAGGIVGASDSGIIKNCINNVNIKGDYTIGGIVGRNNGRIENCISNADISIKGKYLVGGIAGVNQNNHLITDCCNLSIVSSTGATMLDGDSGTPVGAFTGGITGHNNGRITRCINKGTITANYRATGGIAGRNYGTVSYCCNTGNVTGDNITGGIVGNNRKYILYVYNIATQINCTSKKYVGGIAGNQNTSSDAYTKFAYNKSKVIGNSYVGGIIGDLNVGTISNTYNIGTIEGASNVGQIVGIKSNNSSSITNSTNVTNETMKGWNQNTITTNLGQFVKKANELPILNITVRNITF